MPKTLNAEYQYFNAVPKIQGRFIPGQLSSNLDMSHLETLLKQKEKNQSN